MIACTVPRPVEGLWTNLPAEVRVDGRTLARCDLARWAVVLTRDLPQTLTHEVDVMRRGPRAFDAGVWRLSLRASRRVDETAVTLRRGRWSISYDELDS